MLSVALLDFAILTPLAVLLEIPSALALAGGCLTLAYLLGWSLLLGRLGSTSTSSEVARTLISGQSGSALVPLVLVFSAATASVNRLGRRLDAQALGLVAGLSGLFSLGLVSWYGFGQPGDPVGATWVYGLYAILAFAAAGWFGRFPLSSDLAGPDETRLLGWLGSGLVLSSLIQGLAYLRPGLVELPWTMALLAHSTASLAGWMALGLAPLRDWPSSQTLRRILAQSALASSIAAAVVLALSVPHASSGDIAIRLLWLSVVWLAFAWIKASPVAFSASQAALTGSVVFLVTSVLERQGWYVASTHRWIDPRTLQAQAMALGGLGLFWIGIRLAARSRSVAWIDPPWPAFDRFVRAAVLSILVALSVYGVAPGVAQELSPRALALRMTGTAATGPPRVVPPASAFELASIPHRPALGWGSWGVLVVSLMFLLAGQWERFRRVDLLGALIALSMAALLAAGRWEADVAAASALRWSSALMLLIVSALIWTRERLAGWAIRLGWRIEPDRDDWTVLAAASALGLAMLPMLVLALFVGVSALADQPPAPELVTPWIRAGVLFVALSTLGVVGPRVTEHRWARAAGSLVMVLGTLPLVAVTAFAVASALHGNPVVGPEPRSFFGRIGLAGSYVPPILLLATTLVGYAIRDRSSAFAFAAALVMNAAATVGDLLAGAPGSRTLDWRLATHLALLNAVVSAVSVLVWLGSVQIWNWRSGRESRHAPDGRLVTLLSMSVTLNLLVLVGGTAALWWNPSPSAVHDAIAGPWGWTAVGLTVLASVAWVRASGATPSFRMIGFALLALADFAALSLASSDLGDWRTYHAVLSGEALAGGALLLIAWHQFGLRLDNVPNQVRLAVVRWATLALSLVVLFGAPGP